MAMYALATWSLAIGLGFGWNELSFKTFYYFGGIANIPLLAAGSVHLNASRRVARGFTNGVSVFLALGAFAVVLAPVSGGFPGSGVPEGSDIFEFSMTVGGVGVPGPRLFAAIAGGGGTLIIMWFSLTAIVKTWRKRPRVALGNLLIVIGVLVPASAGSLTAFGEANALAFSLLVGAVLLWSGYRIAISGRTETSPRREPVEN